jgi:hypothetical protein
VAAVKRPRRVIRIETQPSVPKPFVAGCDEGRDGRIAVAAPIIRYMVGWPAWRVFDYADRKGWRAAYLEATEERL